MADTTTPLDFTDPTTWDQPMTDADALSMAIFIINDWIEPQASTPEQTTCAEFFAEGTKDRLIQIMEDKL